MAFLPTYLSTAMGCSGNCFIDNYDSRRFGRLQLKQAVKNVLVPWLQPFRNREVIAESARQAALALIGRNQEEFAWVYDRLGDEESRSTLIQILTYRALGWRKVRLPVNNPDYWRAVRQTEDQARTSESVDLSFNRWRAHKIDLNALGYPISLFARPSAIVTQFVLEQYKCETHAGTIGAAHGDVVIDAGGCHGDTALYFACRAGSEGKVYSFEFAEENLRIFRRNLDLNTAIARRVTVVERPLWSKSGVTLSFNANGPATQVQSTDSVDQPGGATSISIDDFVAGEKLAKIDLIKMDIEGAELQALQGAEKTLRAFRPKLAIAVYHRLEDFWGLPLYIESLNLGYRFFLRHFTIHEEETILFASADPGPRVAR